MSENIISDVIETNNISYNWSGFDVGNFHLSHSQRYFEISHKEHDEKQLVRRSQTDPAIAEYMQETTKPTEQICSKMGNLQIKEEQSDDNKENIKLTANFDRLIDELNVSPNEQRNINKPQNVISTATHTGAVPKANAKILPNIIVPTVHTSAEQKLPLTNLNADFNGIPTAKHKSEIPRAYKFKDIYKQKQEQALQQKLEHERKMREFRAGRMPKFDDYEKKVNRQKLIVVTIPETPRVLKHSHARQDQIKQKLEDIKRQHQAPKFQARDARVAQMQPFKPQKQKIVTEMQPFQLNTLQRLEKRKEFDLQIERAMLEKQKQEEEARKKMDEEIRKKLRQNTIFKAKPNPFK